MRRIEAEGAGRSTTAQLLQLLGKLSRFADMFGMQDQSRKSDRLFWLEPARGAVDLCSEARSGARRSACSSSHLAPSVFSHLAPGDPAQLLLGTRQQSPAVIQSVRHEYHLDRAFSGPIRDLAGARDSLRLRSLNPDAGSRLECHLWPAWAELFLGVYATLDRACSSASLSASSRPSGSVASSTGRCCLRRCRACRPLRSQRRRLSIPVRGPLGWFPVFGAGSGLFDRLYHLTLPAFALALTVMALVLKLTRAAMIGALEQDYIVFARARGVSERAVLLTYALRNAAIPIVTAAGAVLGALIAGAVLVEVAFTLPGVGSLLVESVEAKDIPMVQGLIVVIAVVIVARQPAHGSCLSRTRSANPLRVGAA